MSRFTFVAALVLLVACSGGQEASSSTAPPVPLTSDLDDSGVDITIGSVELADITTFAPEGWSYDVARDAFVSPDAGTGIWRVAAHCDDPCGPLTDAEWLSTVDAVVAERLPDQGVVLRDDLTAGRRVVEASSSSEHVMLQARWVAGRPKVLLCEVRAAGDQLAAAADLAAVMEFACDNTRASLE